MNPDFRGEKPVIYVVDDDPSVRRSLERLLRSAGHDVEAFPSASDFLDAALPDRPGCLLLDLNMPEISGLELQERLANIGRTIPVIFITGFGTIPASVKAMKAGAVDFLEKPFEDETLIKALAIALDNDRENRDKADKINSIKKRADSLTGREKEVFGLVVTGMLNKQIAFELGITEKTIKVHRARIMQKMAAASLADLVRLSEKLK
jgi:FixJ family two-component response regulator